ncbi:hypothetical protein LNTAR_03084 [Lentisphaera araneosa HTCC2155]|uniref:General secretion pathway protein G n=1 Tax=Lentisphaera araneosa HTCC2155 TaxID=313628 RepID=A6DT04_9BACT|nr:hypothetical protein LNTAR_03084 [Lentisphaera araneosa HTCC2155]
MKKSKFTLIELLVVVAIIGILAAMILPSLARARDKAKQSNCRGNLKSIGTAIRIYFSDQPNEVVPNPGTDTELNASHIWVTTFDIPSQFLSCPASRENNDSQIYRSVSTGNDLQWGDLLTEPDEILVEDLNPHKFGGTVNKLFPDGHVESGAASP